jgi:hypothetical protein
VGIDWAKGVLHVCARERGGGGGGGGLGIPSLPWFVVEAPEGRRGDGGGGGGE